MVQEESNNKHLFSKPNGHAERVPIQQIRLEPIRSDTPEHKPIDHRALFHIPMVLIQEEDTFGHNAY